MNELNELIIKINQKKYLLISYAYKSIIYCKYLLILYHQSFFANKYVGTYCTGYFYLLYLVPNT